MTPTAAVCARRAGNCEARRYPSRSKVASSESHKRLFTFVKIHD